MNTSKTMNEMMPPTLHAARLRLAVDRPYLATALWSLIPVEARGLGTLAVDRRWRLYYDPDALAEMALDTVVGALYHEICHLLRDHARRAEALSAEWRAFNLAADAEINDDLRSEPSVSLPPGGVYPEQFGQQPGRLAEEYYAALVHQQPPPPPQPGGAVGSLSHPDAGGSAVSPESARDQSAAPSQPPAGPVTSGASGTDHQSSDSSPHQPIRPAPGCGVCGSCAVSYPMPWEDASASASDRVGGISDVEAEIIRQHVAHEIIRIAKSADQRGLIPGHLTRWAKQQVSPRYNWRRALSSAIRGSLAEVSGLVDYSYTRPSRRQAVYPDVIFPTFRRPVPEVAIVVDTSASMTEYALGQALAEISGVIRAAGTHSGVRVLAADAAVHTCQRVFHAQQVRLVGGGGTDMGEGIAAALGLRPRPDVIIVLTDGYTPWPEDAPKGASVIVGLISDIPSSSVPTWARVVRIWDEKNGAP
jgi:predicted metal-dependent peptidase